MSQKSDLECLAFFLQVVASMNKFGLLGDEEAEGNDSGKDKDNEDTNTNTERIPSETAQEVNE